MTIRLYVKKYQVPLKCWYLWYFVYRTANIPEDLNLANWTVQINYMSAKL